MIINNQAQSDNYLSNNQHYLDTYFSIVNETSISNEYCFITEKCIRPMLGINPFLVFGNPHTLKTLKEFGFKTFDKFIDESYDLEFNQRKRFEKVYSEIIRLNGLSNDDVNKIYIQLIPILEHNKNLILEYHNNDGYVRHIIESLQKNVNRNLEQVLYENINNRRKGYLGSVMTELFLKKGYDVTILDNMMYNQTSLIGYSHYKNFNFVGGDVRDKKLLEELVLYNDIIIPLAIVGFPACERDKELATQINYDHVKFICDLVKDTEKRVVYPNTNSGYGIGENGVCTEESPLNPISHYGVTKVNEKEVLGIGGISLRLCVFGTSPRMRMDLLVNEFVYKKTY